MSLNPTQPKNKGFTQTYFAQPYSVILFPQSDSFNPCKGTAIGEEICNTFGNKRLIVRHDEPVTRRVTNEPVFWPNGLVYVWERDVVKTAF